MIGHLKETGQVVAWDFREGNCSPASNNLEFIHQCQQALPDSVAVKYCRIDAAGYQSKIIQYFDEQAIGYAIRAKMSASLKEVIVDMDETQWKPLQMRCGQFSETQSVCRYVHTISNYEKPFTIIIQRQLMDKGQESLPLIDSESMSMNAGHYCYRVIATN